MKYQGFTRSSKPRSGGLWIFLVISLLVAGVAGYGVFTLVATLNRPVTAGPTEVNLASLWEEGQYEEIISYTDHELQLNPMEAGSLMFAGFSHFQLAVSTNNLDLKMEHLNQTLIHLRRLLLLPQFPMLSEVYYVLGKTYFHKGKFFADLAIEYLDLARSRGFQAPDMDEYLGLAYSQIGYYQESHEYFLQANQTNPSDLLTWTLGQTAHLMEEYEMALGYLNTVADSTQDLPLRTKALFLMADIHMAQEDLESAELLYNRILEMNPNSADAYYYLGEIWRLRGNNERARAEWRRAYRIDHLHVNVNQRLFN